MIPAQISPGMQLAPLIHLVFWVLQILVFARVIISWIPSINRHHPVVRLIYEVTEPMLRPFRAVIPVGRGGMDFSPVILLLVLVVVERIILAILGV